MLFKLQIIFSFLHYCITKPHKNGHGIHSPFLYKWITETIYKKSEIAKPIQKTFKKAKNDRTIIYVTDYGAGSLFNSTKKRCVGTIAKIASTQPKYGELFNRIIGIHQPQTVIELGTSLGFGTMYYAFNNFKTKVYTIEGCTQLQVFAKQNFEKLCLTNIKSIQGNFDIEFPKLITTLQKIDVLFIDGNHTKLATMRYFDIAKPFLHDKSIIIFDDIYWSKGMCEAWREICSDKKVRVSLDFFRFGIAFFDSKLQKEHFKIYY